MAPHCIRGRRLIGKSYNGPGSLIEVLWSVIVQPDLELRIRNGQWIHHLDLNRSAAFHITDHILAPWFPIHDGIHRSAINFKDVTTIALTFQAGNGHHIAELRS